jgi:hypothetical protein
MRITASIWRNNLHMKKALLIIPVIVLITSIAQAQITKGSILLGGSIGFGSQKNPGNNEAKQTNIFINPAVGVAVKENLVVGFDALYSRFKSTHIAASNSAKNTSAGGGFFVRRYYPVIRNFYLYAQGNLSYNAGASEQRSTNYEQKSTSNTISLDLAPGLAYALSKKFHMEFGFNDLASIQYGKTKTEVNSNGTASTLKGHVFGFTTGLSTASPFYLGFRVFITK